MAYLISPVSSILQADPEYQCTNCLGKDQSCGSCLSFQLRKHADGSIGSKTMGFYCSSCSGKFDCGQLFQCKSCVKDLAGQPEKKCDSCIVPHIRKHAQDVIDFKGNKAAICEKHQKVRLEYCKTCDVAFCSQCVIFHSKHEFQTLSERDKELKKSIHETLAELESVKEKPLNKKTEEVSELIDNKRKEIANLKQHIANELNLIQVKAYEILDMEQKGIEKELVDLQENVDQLGQMQTKCRTLLSMSTACVLDEFPAFQNQLRVFNTLHQKSLSKKVFLDVVEKNELNPLFKDMITKIEQLLANTERKKSISAFPVGFSSLSKEKPQPAKATETTVETSIPETLHNSTKLHTAVSGVNGSKTLFDSVSGKAIPENKKESAHNNDSGAGSSSSLQHKSTTVAQAKETVASDYLLKGRATGSGKREIPSCENEFVETYGITKSRPNLEQKVEVETENEDKSFDLFDLSASSSFSTYDQGSREPIRRKKQIKKGLKRPVINTYGKHWSLLIKSFEITSFSEAG